MTNKKRFVAMLMVVVLALTTVIGTTLAYFSDTDQQKNTFVTGNVEIDLFEDFGDNDGIEKLLPVTYDAQGNRKADNVIEKEVYVENTGSEDAYVRVHIAIPSRLDNGDSEFNAGKNTLHFNYDKDNSIGKDKWDWSKTTGGAYEGDWNYYETKIKVPFVTVDNDKEVVEEKEVDYNVYVVTYEKALASGEETVDAMSQVYLDKGVTNEEIANIKTELGEKWYIYVAAEGVQAEGFNDAYEALNTEFGTPSAEGYATKVAWNEVAKGDEFKNVD